MHLLIDGYNLLKHIHGIDDPALTREQLIALLNRYAKAKKHQISIVFDAGPFYWPSTSKAKYVQVIFSGQLMTADQYIIKEIGQFKGADVLFISSDRALCDIIAGEGIYCLSSHDFYRFLKDFSQQQKSHKISQKAQVIKTKSKTDPELDELMQMAAQLELGAKKESDGKHERIGAQEKLSKYDKKLQSIIKKL